MDTEDEYRRNADECSRMAQNSRRDEDRAAWLRLADSWLRMLGRTPSSQLGDHNNNDNVRQDRALREG